MKTCEIVGSAFENESINIKIANQVYKIAPDKNMKFNGCCSVYKKITYHQFADILKIKIQIDSQNVILLDTLLILPKSNKEPIISIEDPTKNNNKRGVFIIDDRNIVKP